MQIDEILPFDHNISKTDDNFGNRKIFIDSADLCELFDHKTCKKTVGKTVKYWKNGIKLSNLLKISYM